MSLNTAVTDVSWSPNYSPGRPYGDPTTIVIHHWGSFGQLHQDIVNYLCRPDGNSSAHYVASDGRVTQLVHDYDRAWHAGAGGNPHGIGIECRPECTTEDFHAVARLIAAIRNEWGPLPLVGHRDYMPTACPGLWYARLAELSHLADQYQTGTVTPAPAQPAPKPKPKPQLEGKHKMLMIHKNRTDGKDGLVYAILAPGFWLEFTDPKSQTANGFAKQIGANSVKVTDSFWDHCKKEALAQRNTQ